MTTSPDLRQPQVKAESADDQIRELLLAYYHNANSITFTAAKISSIITARVAAERELWLAECLTLSKALSEAQMQMTIAAGQASVIPPFAEPASQRDLNIRDAARFRALDKRSRYIERPGYRLNIQGDFPWTTLGAYADRLLKWEPESGSFIAPDVEASDPAGAAKGGNANPIDTLAASQAAPDQTLAKAIHYPDCWDTACYSTLAEALAAVYHDFQCSECQAAPAKAEGWEAAKQAYVQLTNNAYPTDSGGAEYIATQRMMRAFDGLFAVSSTPAKEPT